MYATGEEKGRIAMRSAGRPVDARLAPLCYLAGLSLLIAILGCGIGRGYISMTHRPASALRLLLTIVDQYSDKANVSVGAQFYEEPELRDVLPAEGAPHLQWRKHSAYHGRGVLPMSTGDGWRLPNQLH